MKISMREEIKKEGKKLSNFYRALRGEMKIERGGGNH